MALGFWCKTSVLFSRISSFVVVGGCFVLQSSYRASKKFSIFSANEDAVMGKFVALCSDAFLSSVKDTALRISVQEAPPSSTR